MNPITHPFPPSPLQCTIEYVRLALEEPHKKVISPLPLRL
jgi:hypothetical protein